MSDICTKPFSVNDRTYHPPSRPIAVVCLDGGSEEYYTVALAHDRMPNLARMIRDGYYGLARSALPSFTNVNNCAIVTGTPPSRTGIGGNYIIDPQTGEEVMTNSSRFLRNETILAAAANAGRKVAMVTAKDKLRELLSKNLHGIAFSAQRAEEVSLAENGIEDVVSLVGEPPEIYSADASLYVLRSGAELLRIGKSDFCYLTTTDYMQHRYPPSAAEALDFYQAIDELFGDILETGAILAITADHGMNGKCDRDGQPNVIYLESILSDKFGPGCRVICPITDPYVVHHGALGSAVTVYLPKNTDVHAIAKWIRGLVGVTEVYDRESAARILELPADRIGDLFVLSGRDWVVGRSPDDHDLGSLRGPLRSHGGRYEEMVPFVFSERLTDEFLVRANGDPRNSDVFDFVCNGIATPA